MLLNFRIELYSLGEELHIGLDLWSVLRVVVLVDTLVSLLWSGLGCIMLCDFVI